jgi:hypothetical protein
VQSYVDLLRGRGVPLRERPATFSDTDHSAADTTIETVTGSTACRSPLLKEMKLLAMTDRTVLESGSTAFMAFLRAYREHMCSYIFRFDQLDIGGVARSYSLLRLPKIPETRGVKGKPIDFEITNIDTSTIPYPHKEQEEARLRRLRESYAAAAEKDRQQNEEDSRGKRARSTSQEGSDAENSENENSDGEPTTRKFTPHEIFLPKTKEAKKAEQAERKRKQKGGLHKKIMDEWDDLAAEEMAYKKFKKGHISKAEYEACLFSEKKLALDPVTGQPLLRKSKGGGEDSDGSDASSCEGQGSDGASSDDDSSDDSSQAGAGARSKGPKGTGKPKGKPQMRLQYQDDRDSDANDSDGDDHRRGNSNQAKKHGGKGKPYGGAKNAGKVVKGNRTGQSGDYRRVKSGKAFPGSAGKRPQRN